MKLLHVTGLPPLRHRFVTLRADAPAMRQCVQTVSNEISTEPNGLELLHHLSDSALITLVLEAVNEFDLQSPIRPVARGRSLGAKQTATLLGYCYARGILSSEEIEARLSHDAGIAYICAGAKPDWHQLRRFRRENALLLLGVLTRLIELGAWDAEPTRGVLLPERWRSAFREQALGRLQEAIQADCMAMDQ
jgi:hypothetical protein